ncbi:nitroreductase/quinone reductase family protein [Actinomadura kijaniata]|uniref:Deazaflavin-dependent oxidoreductase (Nitroreductase family) n=1 Tax=Actinomadura namibiensis TaxID=182080 RepID=A0A7W3QM00_ACTNM|nr:nitroreductase/quinone reductase family protein [Actinomadura namibiensis]MBA8951508.1 deazaflavin-dependent oxidoreductase (nitroreductase family) [Actinomadura namibiensis]
MPNDFNQQVIEEFRANNGVVGGMFEGGRLLLLTTTGARTGRRHTAPVGYLPDGERVLVIASAGGAPRHPAWFHNLRAHPRVTVEAGAFTYEADAVVLDGAERDAAWARAVESDPGWAAYQEKTARTIPVVALVPVPGPPNLGARGMGDGLKAVHDGFRHELGIIRTELAQAGPRLGAQLRVNCLTMCAGLGDHHMGEDAMLFPGVAARHPELAGTLARLGREHERVRDLVTEIQALVASEDTDPAALLPEFDRLAAELEAHLDYEEEQLVPLLNAMG